MFPPNSYIEALLSNVMVFKDEVFGRQSSLNELMGVRPSWWD